MDIKSRVRRTSLSARVDPTARFSLTVPMTLAFNSGGGMRSNTLASGPGKETDEQSGITFTKTFEVEHGNKENDEIRLVEMDNLSGKGSKVKSRNSSQVSL